MSLSAGDPTPADTNMDMLRLMADPVLLAARIKEFDDAKAAADASIALAGKAEEIIALHEQAKKLQAQAESDAALATDQGNKLLESAQEQAEAIIADADNKHAAAIKDAEEIHAEAADEMTAARQAKTDAGTFMSDMQTKLNSQSDDLKAAIAQASAQASEAAAAIISANSMRDKYVDKMTRIQAIAAE